MDPTDNVAAADGAAVDLPNLFGPIYSVPLIHSLPLGTAHEDGRLVPLQQMPSRADLDAIREFPNGERVAAGFEVVLWHWRRQCSIGNVLADDLAKFTGRTVHDELRTAGKIVDDNPGL